LSDQSQRLGCRAIVYNLVKVNIGTGGALYREVVIVAEGQSLNAFVCDAVRVKIAKMNHHHLD